MRLAPAGWRLLLFTLCLLCMARAAVAEVAVPALKSRVTDLTATLTADQIATLEQTLAAFEARKGSQIAILMLPSTQPEPVEQYAVRVQETWKLGRKGIDDGVLVLVAGPTPPSGALRPGPQRLVRCASAWSARWATATAAAGGDTDHREPAAAPCGTSTCQTSSAARV